MLSRQEAIAFREQTRALAMQIGLRPAARALGLNEERVMKWAQRGNWRISAVRPPLTNCIGPLPQPGSAKCPQPLEMLAAVMANEGDRTRSAMARTARRAFEHADTLDDATLHEMSRSIALEKHAKIASVAHQWNANNVSVGVAVSVPLPSEDERKEMRSIDAKLDAIAAKLR